MVVVVGFNGTLTWLTKNHFILNVPLANFSFPFNGIFFHFSYFYLHYILYDNGRSFFCCIVLLFIYSYYFFALVPFLLLYPSNNKHKDLSNFSYLTLFCTFFFSFSHLTEHWCLFWCNAYQNLFIYQGRGTYMTDYYRVCVSMYVYFKFLICFFE